MFLIVYGWRGIERKVGRGPFYCVECCADSTYVHRRVRRFYTLYEVPLIPAEVMWEAVQCCRCFHCFVPTVLQPAMQAQLRVEGERALKLRRQITEACSLMMCAVAICDGMPSDAVLQELRDGDRYLLGRPGHPSDVRLHMREHSDLAPVFEKLLALSESLDLGARRSLMKAACEIAWLAGAITPSVRELVASFARCLGGGTLLPEAEEMLAHPPAAAHQSEADDAEPPPAPGSPLAELQEALRNSQKR
jgi:hypothetical protein